MKLALSHLAYIPATTRALLSHFGTSPAFEIRGHTYEISKDEMPGEVEWRADYVRWMVQRFVHYLARRPYDAWGKTMAEIEEEAVLKCVLLFAEARFVSEAVLLTLQEMEPANIALLANNAAHHDAQLKTAGQDLSTRFEQMVVEYGRKLEARC